MEILQKTIEQIRKQYGLAGGILVAVKDGKVVLKECFGQADAEQNKPVDSKTLFQIASCSKAFTTMVAGQLCDEGKMTWDTPVKQLMPDFRMVDKYAEQHVTPRDMGCHPVWDDIERVNDTRSDHHQSAPQKDILYFTGRDDVVDDFGEHPGNQQIHQRSQEFD